MTGKATIFGVDGDIKFEAEAIIPLKATSLSFGVSATNTEMLDGAGEVRGIHTTNVRKTIRLGMVVRATTQALALQTMKRTQTAPVKVNLAKFPHNTTESTGEVGEDLNGDWVMMPGGFGIEFSEGASEAKLSLELFQTVGGNSTANLTTALS
jgi:hydrogenase maturation factor